jgi:hypothetical protein
MRYAISKINSRAKRHVSPKVMHAELWSVEGSAHGQGALTSAALTLDDPRTPEGLRMRITFAPEDMKGPPGSLMAAWLGRLYSMMPVDLRAEVDRIVRREDAISAGRCPAQHGHYDCAKPEGHPHDHATHDGLFVWPRALSDES